MLHCCLNVLMFKETSCSALVKISSFHCFKKVFHLFMQIKLFTELINWSSFSELQLFFIEIPLDLEYNFHLLCYEIGDAYCLSHEAKSINFLFYIRVYIILYGQVSFYWLHIFRKLCRKWCRRLVFGLKE